MISTATHETQPPTYGFLHEILYLVIFTTLAFGTWTGVRVLAAIKALTHLCTYIMNLLEEPQRQPFRFLDLPAEVRNLVYDQHFTLYRTPWYQKKAREMAMLPDAILNVNRQVYEEASHALYFKVHFVIKITGRANVHGDERPFAGVVRKIPHILKHMSTIDLEIRWPRSDWHGPFGKGERHGRSVTELKKNIKTVSTSLAKLPNLRTMKITFLVEESSGSLRRLSPAVHRIPGLLRPLKLVRRAIPEIVVGMPDYCPMSTAELADQQEDCPYGLDWLKEINEDLKETMGDSMALAEELRMMDEEMGW